MGFSIAKRLSRTKELRSRAQSPARSFEILFSTLISFDRDKNSPSRNLFLRSTAKPSAPLRTILGENLHNGLVLLIHLGVIHGPSLEDRNTRQTFRIGAHHTSTLAAVAIPHGVAGISDSLEDKVVAGKLLELS